MIARRRALLTTFAIALLLPGCTYLAPPSVIAQDTTPLRIVASSQNLTTIADELATQINIQIPGPEPIAVQVGGYGPRTTMDQLLESSLQVQLVRHGRSTSPQPALYTLQCTAAPIPGMGWPGLEQILLSCLAYQGSQTIGSAKCEFYAASALLSTSGDSRLMEITAE